MRAVLAARAMTLDALDKRLSYPFFLIELGALEIPLSPIFTWFGAPLPAMGFMPHLIALASPGGAGRAAWAATAVALGAAVAAHWARCVRAGDLHAFYTTRPVLPLLVATCALARLTDRAAAVSFYLVHFFVAESLVLLVKARAGRVRPGVCAALGPRLARARRRLPQITFVGMSGPTCIESFPSGDAAGAAVFAYALRAFGGWSRAAAALVAAGAAFGRLYLFAHHLGDVAAGAAIALATGVALDAWAAPLGLAHVAFGVPAFAAAYALATRLRRPLPPEFREKQEG